ncbi:hypothetical protein T4B_10119 [Trichinella pseudospiralis]|uniref:Uncharacterized protein n=1 Tax=Trichinella pseudospiralis TaxID=6337 RepID=A0A0V1KE94_TRIPS|nr:hypothetical protein T4B_10119 [Trichinella pseudospiralis]KRZ45536.1 hypothetical protein T4C_3617 [Trichinella pseudospiralis]
MAVHLLPNGCPPGSSFRTFSSGRKRGSVFAYPELCVSLISARATALTGLCPEFPVIIANGRCSLSRATRIPASRARSLGSVMWLPIQGSESLFQIFDQLFKDLSSVAAFLFEGVN